MTNLCWSPTSWLLAHATLGGLMQTLTIKNLTAEVDGKQILNGINLEIKAGEIHALMGPNGSGKSTLSNVLAGHPDYTVTGGTVSLNGENLLEMNVTQRSLSGLFLAFQQPMEVPGLTIGKYLKRIVEIRLAEGERMNVSGFIKDLKANLDTVGLDHDFINRYLNEGFSGGEKKRMELIQMMLLKPSFAILDEIDSGLDIDALKTVATGVNKLKGENFGALIITHYQRIMENINPDFVHILYQGRIVKSGGRDLVNMLESKGYGWVREEFNISEEADEYQRTIAS